MNQVLQLTLLGTGSSGGVPRLGNDWGACDPAEPRNRRRRCSALLKLFDASRKTDCTTLLIDTSPDMREQLLDAQITRLDGIAYTHDHADQTHGIDDIRALVIRNRKPVPVWMDKATRSTLLPKFRYCFEGAGGYPPILDLQADIQAGHPFSVSGPGGCLTLLPVLQQHGRIVSLGFRIGSLAYCNDVNELSEQSLAALHGLEVLVIDALRYTPHPTHAHLEQALAWIDQLRPRRAILTNLHVDLDYATLCKSLPQGVEPGYDGLCLELAYQQAS